MTDLATKPDDETVEPTDAPTEHVWAPTEERPRPSRRAWWISGGAGVGVVALVAASLVLIAPGTSASGVDIGFLTAGGAADRLDARLDATTVTVGGEELSARDLGFSIDASAVGDAAWRDHPLWNPSSWFQQAPSVQLQIDGDVAADELAGVVPDVYDDAQDAVLAFDAASNSYAVTPSVDGQAVDLGALRLAVQRAFEAGETDIAVDAVPVAVPATVDTAAATAEAAELNGMLGTAGFYAGDERVVALEPATVASWLTVTADDETGEFTVSADEAAIQSVVDTLPGLVNRDAVNATIIVNSQGRALSDITPGVEGRVLGDTTGLASDVATQLGAGGGGAFAVSTTATPFTTTNLYRHIEVNLSSQRAYLIENDTTVYSWAISSGKEGYSSTTGRFAISSKLTSQNMGNRDLEKAPHYFTPNVPWVMYYHGDEALHGAYWHNNFGNVMSHGCINMPVSAASLTYQWAPIGTEVWVHY